MRAIPLALLLSLAAVAQRPSEMASAGLDALNKGQYTTAVYFLKKAVDLEPRHMSAWTALGRSYLALDQVDAALDAQMKQIDVNPKCPDVYENLGLALLRKGKRDEAMEAFKQQVEVAPENSSAHASLGNLYYELQRYPEAVAELEKAVALNPQNIPDQVNLGGAYLGAGQTDKGLAILDQVVQDRPLPGAWNGVAFKLASHRVKLDKAEKYAESAVATQSIALRNAEIDHVTAVTLRMAVQLATAWDTLGWVYFQSGHADEAAKFIKAAWALNPTGPIGDHLGQLNENRGQKPEVTHTFKAGKLVAEKASAEFNVAQTPVPGTTEIRFVRGDEKLRQFAEAVEKVLPAGVFPDATATQLIRRVTLTCPGEGGECEIELLSAAAALTTELNAIPPETHISDELRPGVYHTGGGVSPPVPIYRPEPEYSEKARKARYQGTVVMYVEVTPQGRAQNIRVIRSLGLGLDEKAIEALSRWEFKPGMKDGHPVTVAATVEINFRLLKDQKRH